MKDIAQAERMILATDCQGSLLSLYIPRAVQSFAYTAYGHARQDGAQHRVVGFIGQKREATGSYLLGNGYRAYAPSLMRFNAADNMSPFGAGGINAYAYCKGDPINRTDRSGHVSLPQAFLTLTMARVDPRAFQQSPLQGYGQWRTFEGISNDLVREVYKLEGRIEKFVRTAAKMQLAIDNPPYSDPWQYQSKLISRAVKVSETFRKLDEVQRHHLSLPPSYELALDFPRPSMMQRNFRVCVQLCLMNHHLHTKASCRHQ
ncbi:RHS repeat-associated core domain-containing protein [Pseudomonas carassii]|uniref:RHS repeat-associated core domain-containing protein n=1 Tax=Pseudomonas carassii TaxID=3115855 RepID=UPI0038B5828D